MRIRRILAPTDFGRPATAALDLAVEIARATGATLVILHVCDAAAELVAASGRSTTELGRAIRNAAERDLDDVLERTRAAVREVVGVIKEGSPVREILDVATKRGVDLVIMGTHGRRGARRLLLGSVAEGVVRRSNAPVITVRADRSRSRVPRFWIEDDAVTAEIV